MAKVTPQVAPKKIMPNTGAGNPAAAGKAPPTESKPKAERNVRKPVFKGEKPTEGWTREALRAAGYSADKHRPLKSKEFVSKPEYLEYKADLLEMRVKAIRQDAQDIRDGKGPSVAKVQARLDKMSDKVRELIQTLKKGGQDTSKYDAMLKVFEEQEALEAAAV